MTFMGLRNSKFTTVFTSVEEGNWKRLALVGKKKLFPSLRKKKIEAKISKFLLFLIVVPMSVSGIIFCTLMYFFDFFFFSDQPTHVFNNSEQNITRRKI